MWYVNTMKEIQAIEAHYQGRRRLDEIDDAIRIIKLDTHENWTQYYTLAKGYHL